MKRACSIVLAVLACASASCADKPPPAPPTTTASPTPSLESVSPGIGMSQEIARACNIKLSGIDTAPKFDYDRAELLPEDRDVLQKLAVCVTTGPLKGRALRLIGRADPRGEPEYNMTLGAQRAGSARNFLTHLGVDPNKVAATSRGELDATGVSESGWRRDRRVDVLLQ